jgi:hypothetical protein
MYICHFFNQGQYQGGFRTREDAEAYGRAACTEFKVWTRRQFFNR